MEKKDKLLILDLDETLVYATTAPLERAADFSVGPYHVYKRPHLDTFLETCLSWFDVAVWTSSSPAYAAGVVDALFPLPDALAFSWACDRCTRAYDVDTMEYYWRKPMAKVKRRREHGLKSIIVVDDTPRKWEQSYGNLVAVKPFEGSEADDELPRLLRYLDILRQEQNIRSVEKRYWRRTIS